MARSFYRMILLRPYRETTKLPRANAPHCANKPPPRCGRIVPNRDKSVLVEARLALDPLKDGSRNLSQGAFSAKAQILVKRFLNRACARDVNANQCSRAASWWRQRKAIEDAICTQQTVFLVAVELHRQNAGYVPGGMTAMETDVIGMPGRQIAAGSLEPAIQALEARRVMLVVLAEEDLSRLSTSQVVDFKYLIRTTNIHGVYKETLHSKSTL